MTRAAKSRCELDRPTLTPKQEAFVQGYLETGNASKAYRRAYSAETMRANTINREAKALLDNRKIAARLSELQSLHVERHNVTVDDISRMLLEDRALARKLNNPAAAVAASMGLAKLYGHLTNKGQHTGAIILRISPEDAML